jgi:hypothetical protein
MSRGGTIGGTIAVLSKIAIGLSPASTPLTGH